MSAGLGNERSRGDLSKLAHSPCEPVVSEVGKQLACSGVVAVAVVRLVHRLLSIRRDDLVDRRAWIKSGLLARGRAARGGAEWFYRAGRTYPSSGG